MAENKPACFHCKDSSSDSLMNGWKGRTGEYAQLCHRCYTIYNAGQFCETFHEREDGWRDCNSCKKLIHCGCVVSLSDYSMEDFGGIICVDCSRFLVAQFDLNAEPNPSDSEMQSMSTAAEPIIVLLFEKVMTASDARLRNNRMVIPTKYAKAYFPEVSHGQRVMLNILDTEGNEWHLDYYCWLQGKYKIYILQGLKDLMISNNVQAGNTVAFYMRKSDEKMIIELRKTSVAVRTHKASSSRGK